MSYAAVNSSVFRCALKVVMVAELFVTGNGEFQTAGAMILNELQTGVSLTRSARFIENNNKQYR